MEQHAGIDVSLEASHVCVVDAEGKILKEAKVTSEPDAIAWFAGYGPPLARIGLEAGPLSQWLNAGMKAAVGQLRRSPSLCRIRAKFVRLHCALGAPRGTRLRRSGERCLQRECQTCANSFAASGSHRHPFRRHFLAVCVCDAGHFNSIGNAINP